MSAGFASIAEKWAQELKAKDKQKDETEETKNDESKGKKSVESEELKSNKEDKDDGLKEWWYLSGPDGRRNKKKGPATWKQVCKLGNPTQQHIWKEGMERWMTLAECKLIANGDAWYYIDISGGQQGPMSKWDLVNRAVTDQVKAETMIWKHGTAISWLPANQIEDLRLACGFKKPKDLPQQTENMDTDEPAPAATPDQELEWYWEDQYREKQGPVNKPELIMMLEREKIADQTLVWKAGMDDWVTLHEALFGRKVEQSVAPVAKDENEEENVEDIRHRLVKEVALTEECDPNSKVLGTVAQLTIVKILEAKDERVKVEAPKLTGWCKAEDEDGPLIERVKAKDLVKKRKRKKKRKWKDVQAPAVYVQGFPPDITVKEIEEYFKKCGNIKRDILTGHLKIKVTYPEEEASLGNTLQVGKTGVEPTVQFDDAVDGQKYTIAMIDPDAPSKKNPRAANWNHWLVTNVEGASLKAGTGLTNGKVLMKYSGPAPPKGSGPHRYVFIVYKQPRNLNSRVSRNRARFDLGGFAKKNKLGNPVGGNFFLAENK